MNKSLNDLLVSVASEVTEEEVLKAQQSLSEAEKDENVKMVWRMFAAAPKND